VRVFEISICQSRLLQRFHREAAIWKRVFSKDLGKLILPFYGVCSDDGPYPCVPMTSCWPTLLTDSGITDT
jgi:hypothetical protein